jgi:hypothetical protein
MSKRQIEQARIMFRQAPSTERPVEEPKRPVLHPRQHLMFDRARLRELVANKRGDWINLISGEIWNAEEPALHDAHKTLQAVGDYSDALSELQRRYKELINA